VVHVRKQLTEAEYAEYLAARATENLPTQPPPDAQPHLTNEEFTAVQNDRLTKRHERLQKLTVYEKIIAGRDERMLARHNKMEAEWERHRNYVSKRLHRSVDQLVVSKAEEFREKVELFDLLDRATPVGIKSGGYSWYHSLRNDGSRHVQVGNMFSGLSFLMKMRKENYVDELVRKERLVEQCKARKGGTDNPKTWRDDEYLVARLRRYRATMNDLAPGRLDYEEMLVCEGKKCILYDQDDEGMLYDPPNWSQGNSLVDEMVRNLPTQTTQKAPAQAAPKPGPHAELSPRTLQFPVAKGEMKTQEVTITNSGTTVVYFTWVHSKPPPCLAESVLPHDPTTYFHCLDLEFKLLPGEQKLCTFAFLSSIAGSFTDTWHLATEPALATPLEDLVVYGLCTQQDLFVEDRLRFAEQMRDIQLEHQVHEMVNDVVLRVKTATPPPPDFTNPKVQEKIFEERNAPEGLYWTPYVWNELHKLVPRIQKFCAGLDITVQDGEPQVLDLSAPDPALDVHVFEWDKSVVMLERELHALRKPETPDPVRENLERELARLRRLAEMRPAHKSPVWNSAYEAVLNMVHALPDALVANAVAHEITTAKGRPLQRPFISPDDPEREKKLAEWEEKRAPKLEAALAKNPDFVESMLETLPLAPFVTPFATLAEEAEEAELRRQLLAPAPSLLDTFELYSSKINTEVEMAGVVLYELDLALKDLVVVDGRLKIEDDTELRARLAGIQDILDAGALAVFIVGHLGAPAPAGVDPDVNEWENAFSPGAAPSLEPVFDVVYSMYAGATPSCEFLKGEDFLTPAPIPNLREEPEGKLFMVENLNSFYEEQGVVRLENGKVRRMPLAEREAWCERFAWKNGSEFYVQDSLASAANPSLVSAGLWKGCPQRLLGTYIEQELELIKEALNLLPAKEEKGEEEEVDEEEEEKKEATPAGPMLMFLGGQGLDAQGALKRKCDLLRAMCPLVSSRVCLGGEFALYALETWLEVPTGLDVPANMRATLREFFYNVLVSGAQVYLPLDVVCELVVEPEPYVPPEPADPNDPDAPEPPEPPEPPPKVITVDLMPALRAAAGRDLRGNAGATEAPTLDVGPAHGSPCPSALLRIPKADGRTSVETVDSWLDETLEEVVGDFSGVPPGYAVRDIGPMTVEAWKELMRLSRGLVWNDVLGKVEDPQFSQGTQLLVEHVQNRHEDEGDEDEEEEEEEDDEDEEEDEDGNPIERPPKPPKPYRAPSIEFETSVFLGKDVGRMAEQFMDTSQCAYLTLSEEVVELLRGPPLPGLANLANKATVAAKA